MEKASYISKRIELYDKLKADYLEFISRQERKNIVITLKDGSVINGKAWESTPYSVMRDHNQNLADNAIVAKVNGVLKDLDELLVEDCFIEFLDFDDKDGQYVFWHSSAHVLGEALEQEYHCKLCYGPPVEEGFYYDMSIDQKQVKAEDYKSIETKIKKIVKEKQKFERLEVSVETLMEMFDYNEFKCRILKEKVKTATTTIYRCGDLIDLCQGPHVRNTGKIKAISVTKNSSSYWEGNAEAESLQRVYGISFPDPKQLKEWKTFQLEAIKRDHRKIGEKQMLFFFNDISPGCTFFEPKGTIIKNKLTNFMKSEYLKRGFSEVDTPTIFNTKLWETSGHWEHYRTNMFLTEVDKTPFGLKPMNCPGHCVIFNHRIRSYKDLPIRMADFGVLHRNEASGALSGLTRVRKFHQDDAHIFCTEDQMSEEIASCLDFLKHVYGLFGFNFRLNLSTRPDKFLGEERVWNKAEEALKSALDKFGQSWILNEGDGAFYGPKIDVTITDALKRPHQCATIQLDFQLPERFNLNYMRNASLTDGDNGTSQLSRPVIIHRAILGSVERMIAILTEHFGGKWPFWLSPFQVIVFPLTTECDNYALGVQADLTRAGIVCDIDLDSGRTIDKKTKMAQEGQYNFMLFVGKTEVANGSVNVRRRDIVPQILGERSLSNVIEQLTKFNNSKTLHAELEFE